MYYPLWYLHLFAGFAFLIALVLSAKLYTETDKGWYWISLLFSALFFSIGHWLNIIFPMNIYNFQLLAFLQETSEIFGALLFAAASYGIYSTMKEIRKRVE